MLFCAFCMLQLPPNNDTGMCFHHSNTYNSDWAKTNRVICDGIHRGKWLKRLSEKERSVDFQEEEPI